MTTIKHIITKLQRRFKSCLMLQKFLVLFLCFVVLPVIVQSWCCPVVVLSLSVVLSCHYCAVVVLFLSCSSGEVVIVILLCPVQLCPALPNLILPVAKPTRQFSYAIQIFLCLYTIKEINF